MPGWTLATLLTLATAGTVDATPSPAVAPPAPAAVMAIPPELANAFHRYAATRGDAGAARIDVVVDFLFRPEGLAMRYRQDATFTVAEAFRTREANCLTFTLLTVALARASGLRAYGQQIAKSLAWRREGNTIYRTIHVNAGVRIGARPLTVDVAWDRVITGDPPEPISDERLLAHYYNNRTVELADAGDLASARAHAALSLTLDPRHATSWSNAGALASRAGEGALAERDALRALALDPEHVSAMINLIGHYQRNGMSARALPYLERLEAVQKRDPLRQFILALDFEKRGEWQQAARHYRRAIALYDGEYRFHAGLARTYAALGEVRRSARALRRAERLDHRENRCAAGTSCIGLPPSTTPM